MSKLSPALKAFINAPTARPGTIPAPPHISYAYRKIAQDAESRRIGLKAWFSGATAATITMNSPGSLLQLYNLAATAKPHSEAVYLAELVREIGLKCVGFNGIPRTINCLGEFREELPAGIIGALDTQSRRSLNPENIPAVLNRGRALWKSIYRPYDEKLVAKLALSHPDLPVHIIESEYGNLFSDQPALDGPPARVGRVLTSVMAIACLRAQTGAGPQLESHVFGLRKAYEDGTARVDGEEEIEGGQWLASDEGSIWLLETIDRIVEAISKGTGTSFTQRLETKL